MSGSTTDYKSYLVPTTMCNFKHVNCYMKQIFVYYNCLIPIVTAQSYYQYTHIASFKTSAELVGLRSSPGVLFNQQKEPAGP